MRSTGKPNDGSSGAYGGNGDYPWAADLPPEQEQQLDPDFWTDYKYNPNDFKKKKKKDNPEEQTCTPEQLRKKAGISELPESSSGNYVFDVTIKTAREELRNLWKDKNLQDELLNGLDRMDQGNLLPRNVKDFKGYKSLKEIKLKELRMLIQPGKNGQPDKIISIFRKPKLQIIKKCIKGRYN